MVYHLLTIFNKNRITKAYCDFMNVLEASPSSTKSVQRFSPQRWLAI
jgi:hypothetical protein